MTESISATLNSAIANDAATLPASLVGVHRPAGKAIEVRLAGRPSLDPLDVNRFSAVVFGEGDFHVRTEDRPLPPPLKSVVDAILSGTHEPGTSHYELLRAFLEDSTLERATAELDARGYRTHEFGDSVLIF
ncbi:MAG TPA: hypothetical protein VF435_17265 [Pyrinomonadaceae bacterium]